MQPPWVAVLTAVIGAVIGPLLVYFVKYLWEKEHFPPEVGRTPITDPAIRKKIQDLAEQARDRPSDPEPCSQLGMLYRDQTGDSQIAIRWFKMSIRRKPNTSFAYDRIAEVYRDKGQFRKALQWFMRSAKADPTNQWPCDRVAEIYRDRFGDLDKAVHWFEESARRAPRLSWPRDRLGEIYRDRRHDYDKAIAWFERSAAVDPHNSWPCDRLGLLFRDVRGDRRKAAEWFVESARRGSDSQETYTGIGLLLGDEMEWVERTMSKIAELAALQPANNALQSIREHLRLKMQSLRERPDV